MVYKKGLASRYAETGWIGSSTAKKASQALYMVSKLARSLNTEKKYYDKASSSPINLASGPIISLINGVGFDGTTAGGAGTERSGESLCMTSVQYKLNLFNSDSGTRIVRVMIVMDKQADGTAPTLAEIFQPIAGNRYTIAPNNMDNKFRFTVLHDRLLRVQPTGTENDTINVEHFKKLGIRNKKTKQLGKGIKVRYNADAPDTVANVSSNPLYLIVFLDGATQVDCNYFSRVRFVDN